MPRNTGNFPLARALSALILLTLALAAVRSATAFDGTRIHGQVIHPRGGALPFDEMDVWLKVEGELHATVPDAHGRFSFDFDEPPTSATIQVGVDYPLRFCAGPHDAVVPIDAQELEGSHVIQCLVAERGTGIVHGIAVDAETRSPLPGVRFDVRPRGGWQLSARWFEPFEITTDERGEFVTESHMNGGVVAVEALRENLRAFEPHVDCVIPAGRNAAPWIVPFTPDPPDDPTAVGKGARVQLRLSGRVPLDLSNLRAWMIDAEGDWIGEHVRLSRDPYSRTVHVVPRFVSPSETEIAGIAVGDLDGLIFGEGSIARGASGGAFTAAIRLRDTAAFDWDWGEPGIPDGMYPEEWEERMGIRWIEFEPIGTLAVDPTLAARLRRGGRWLPEGDYIVRSYSRVHRETIERIHLVAGQHLSFMAELKLAPRERKVHGTLRTDSGGPLPELSVVVRQRWSNRYSYWVFTHEEETWCGTGIDFRTDPDPEDLSRATFTLRWTPEADLNARANLWEPGLGARVRWNEREDGDLDCEVVVLDAADSVGYGIWLVDVPNVPGKGRVEGNDWARLHVRTQGVERLWDTGFESGQWIDGDGPTAGVDEWAVMVKGCRPVQLEPTDFIAAPTGGAFATPRFELGWGTRLIVQDSLGAPLANAQVWADDEPLGTTDGDGRFDIALEKRPTELRVESAAPGSGSRRYALSGDWGADEPWLELRVIR